MKSILVIEDDAHIAMALKDDFEYEGFHVHTVPSGRDGLSAFRQGQYDLVILDIMLPDLNGFDVCKAIRKDDNLTPILMLTAKDKEIDKILGLELGADDYVTKPFSPRELLARVKALMRRSENTVDNIDYIRIGDIELDFKKYEAKKAGKRIPLTALEFTFIHFLIQNKNRVVSRDQILDAVWGDDVLVTHRTVDTHIANLRKKLESNPANPIYIICVRGVGYMLVIDE